MMAPKKRAKRKTKKHDVEQEFYVGLLESESIQRELLEARRSALILIKRLEKALLMREQRIYLEGELRDAIAALSSEIERVMKSLPELPASELRRSAPPVPMPKPAAPKRSPSTAQMSDIDRKLADIDQRLSGLE